MTSAQLERNKTREQIEEEKKISLSFRIKPLAIEGFSVQKLQFKATELWDQIVKLETEKYDLEERQKRQDYDVKTFFFFFLTNVLEFYENVSNVLVERVERTSEATTPSQGSEEGSRPRSLDRQIPSKHNHCKHYECTDRHVIV